MSVSELAFGLYGQRAGLIRRDRGRTVLRYDADYIAQDSPTPHRRAAGIDAGSHDDAS